MSKITSDPTDPRLTHGADSEPVPQAEAYLVLSEKEREKGFVRPVRRTYVHWYTRDGSPFPIPLTSADLPNIGGCGAATTMSQAIAETYARDPKFYRTTYCVGCSMHLPVSEFTWEDGTVLGS